MFVSICLKKILKVSGIDAWMVIHVLNNTQVHIKHKDVKCVWKVDLGIIIVC